MHKKYNHFLIISFVGVLILGVYSYFYNDLISEAASNESSIASSLDDNGITETVKSVSDDVAFLMKLVSLKTINIDTSLFEDKAFNLLVDNNIKLEPVPFGRVNPFSPIDNFRASSQSSYILKTNLPTLVSTVGATLNGSLAGVSSNNIYFEYGTTETLGKSTSKVTPSLAGIFSSNLTGLAPKTTYFFRAVANINGTINFGEVISFNTN